MKDEALVTKDQRPKTKAVAGSSSFVFGLSSSWLLPTLAFCLMIALWEALVRGFNVPLYLLPAPSGILEAFFQQPGYLLQIGLFTFGEALAGFAIGCTLGSLVAVICVRFPLLAEGLVPFSVASNAVPIVALSPLLGIWLGSISPASKIGVVAIMTFFPTLINVYRGLTSPSADTLQLMRSYAARQRDIFVKLRLPAALPYLFNALKICASLSMIGAIVSEFFGGRQSALGVYIKSQAGLLRLRECWSGILMACMLGIVFYLLIAAAERLVMPWHMSFRRER
jgi:NitT/TauT family transport system permease protein